MSETDRSDLIKNEYNPETYNEIINNPNYSAFMEHLKCVLRETEPQLLNMILIDLTISERRFQDVEFI